MAQAAAVHTGHTDLHPGWIDRWMPMFIRPYLRLMRLDRPIGTWLLLFPGWWSIALATPGQWPDWRLMALFGVGAVVMRGAGCTLNDILDRNLDGKVERTKTRPLPSRQVSLFRAFAFLGLQLAVGLAILLQLNWFAIKIGATSLLLVAIYPLMKRVTWWPQFFLGLAFNWGALLGWSAVTGSLGWPPVLLYLGGIFWTLAYDTIYAHQDKADDLKAGMKSTALLFGSASKAWVLGFYAAAAVLWGLAGWQAGEGGAFRLALAFVILHFVDVVRSWNIDDPANCLKRFRANRATGWLLLAGIVFG